nr:hypothetical protein [Micromonospora tarensis]
MRSYASAKTPQPLAQQRVSVADGGGCGADDQVSDWPVDVRVYSLVVRCVSVDVRVKGHPPGQVPVDQDCAREPEGEGLSVHVGVTRVVVAEEE